MNKQDQKILEALQDYKISYIPNEEENQKYLDRIKGAFDFEKVYKIFFTAYGTHSGMILGWKKEEMKNILEKFTKLLLKGADNG